MKTSNVVCILASILFAPVVNAQQTNYNQTAKDIEHVERDYYAIPYAMQLTVLTNAAKVGKGVTIDEAAIKQPMANAETFDVSLSGITTGQTADIQTRPWSDFITIPGTGQEIIRLDVTRPNFNGTENAKYGSVTAQWGPMDKPDPGAPDPARLTMQDLLLKLDDLYATHFARFVAYTVTLQYQGRSVNYKAIYFFSGDDLSHQIVDLYLQGERYSDFSIAYRPDRVLVSKWRDIPILHDWLVQHTLTDSKCTEMNHLCCIGGRCGMRKSDVDRKMTRQVMGGMSSLEDWQMPAVSTRPLADSNCVPFSAETCACDLGCAPLVQPYSDTPGASCLVDTKKRIVNVFGLVPTGKYHNWIVTVVHLAGFTNQDEIFDGGPTGVCPFCGNIGAWADLPPQGHESGDLAGGGGGWHSSGMSPDNCDSVIDIQSYIFGFGTKGKVAYNTWGPNSNSVAFSAMEATDLFERLDWPQQDPKTSPGWGMFL